MDHTEVIERIELAAVEPGGLARLAAGDTPDAAAVAGHLAGCADCAAMLARTGRTAAVAREAIRELPDPALRARTLAFVRDVGIDRPAGVAAMSMPDARVDGDAARIAAAAGRPAADAPSGVPGAAGRAEPAAVPGAAVHGRSTPQSSIRGRRRIDARAAWWAAASMAAVLIAAAAGFAAGGAGQPPGNGSGAVAAVRTTVHIAQQPDQVRIDLVAADSGSARGSVMYSVSSGELAMVASGLDPAPSGSSYACWVEQGGQRRRIGGLYLAGGDGEWAGPVSGLGDIEPGAVFGVSLVSDGAAADTAVLTGSR